MSLTKAPARLIRAKGKPRVTVWASQAQPEQESEVAVPLLVPREALELALFAVAPVLVPLGSSPVQPVSKLVCSQDLLEQVPVAL